MGIGDDVEKVFGTKTSFTKSNKRQLITATYLMEFKI
jgi:hypothetical protein